MNGNKTPGPLSRQHNEVCFCKCLAQLLAAQPAERRAEVVALLALMRLRCRWPQDLQFSDMFWTVEDAMAAVFATYPSLPSDLMRTLAAPLNEDCDVEIFLGIAHAILGTLWDSPLGAANVVRALHPQLSGHPELFGLLSLLAISAPQQAMECLYGVLCANSEFAGHAEGVLEMASPNWRVTHDWLCSPFPGPRAAAIAYMSFRDQFYNRFPAMAIKAMDDPEPCVRSCVAKTIYRFAVCKDLKEVAVRALNDRDRNVRRALGDGLLKHATWTREMLPVLLPTLLYHYDDHLRTLVAGAIGQLGKRGTSAIPALKTAAEDRNSKVAKAARNSLALLGAGKTVQPAAA